MKIFLLILLQMILLVPLSGQTIIDLKPGGGVRAKTAEEYRKPEPGLTEKMRADSLQYNDNVTRALNALYRDSLKQAESLLTEALKLRPNAPANFIVRHYLGRIDMARGNYREAIAQFTPLLKDRPENRAVRFDRASCYLEIKNTKAALEDCDALMKHELPQEELIRTLFLSSACHTADRHPEKAKLELERILAMVPDHESAQLLLAYAYLDMGQTSEALNRLNLFVSSHPQSVEGLVARAELEEQLDMQQAARADYDSAIRLDNKRASLYAKRAQLLQKMGLEQLAGKDLQKAISLGYPASKVSPAKPQNK